MQNWNWIANGTNSGSSPTLTTLIEEADFIDTSTNLTDAASEIINTPGPSNSLRIGDASNRVELNIPVSSDVYVSAKIRMPLSESSSPFCSFWGSGGTLRACGAGMNSAVGGFTALNVNSVIGSFFCEDWCPDEEFVFEMYCKSVVGVSAGTVTIRINGVEVYSNTATQTYSFAAIDQVRFRNLGGTGTTMEVRDIIICDNAGSICNTWIGQDKHVYGLLPNADGNYSQWTRSTGATDYTLVDEVSRDSTDYLESSTTNDQTSVGLEATGSEADILAVQIHANAKLDTGTGPETVGLFTRHSTSDSTPDSHSFNSTTEKAVLTVEEVCPSTSAQWTAAQLDAAEIGIEYGV